MLVIESYGVLQITQTKSFPIPILSPSRDCVAIVVVRWNFPLA
jgi:hypothetical protein